MRRIEDIMTSDPSGLSEDANLIQAAQLMDADDIGDVLILRDGGLAGILTDRDIVVRGLAAGKDPNECTVGEIATRELVTISPDDDVDEAVRLMSEHALRRLPVVRDGKVLGIVSIGDLAVEQDPESALADISAASPDE
jgi:CBS domain-containing protein